MSIIIVKSVIYIYVYILNNNYSLTTDLVLFLGLILILIFLEFPSNNFLNKILNMFLFNNIPYKVFSHFSLLKNHYYQSIL